MKVELEQARDLRVRLDGGETALGIESALMDPVVMEIYEPYGAALARVRSACRAARLSPGVTVQAMKPPAATDG